ncbi:threonine/homoserine/homoserine lactone efflux protein [Kribbella amoyensis]|uniref:Threonine/homoserine/homoserine lactone efflux protein n=1 Tax=Kribbella amoyensis TaxID=996641 RepID=A0A561BZ19_9ACTN|nr:LysE family translocator [Kribbella amoyensis]TWD84101.1 threonine/homoserine/homoserine lactone efflux protein [Kribbella amoyensis]
MGIGQGLGFVGATVVLVGLPGPNNLYISLRSLTQGRRAGVVSAIAIETGTVVYILAAALGLAALVQTSPGIITAISLTGATYLAYLGLRTLRRPAAAEPTATLAVEPLGRIFRAGVLVNLLNPKAALFFLAFLPQFATSGAGPEQLRNELLLLGLAVLVIGLALDLCYAVGAAELGRRLKPTGRGQTVQRWTVAGIYLAIAAAAAISAIG